MKGRAKMPGKKKATNNPSSPKRAAGPLASSEDIAAKARRLAEEGAREKS